MKRAAIAVALLTLAAPALAQGQDDYSRAVAARQADLYRTADSVGQLRLAALMGVFGDDDPHGSHRLLSEPERKR